MPLLWKLMSDSRRLYKTYTKQQSRNSNRPTDICINYNTDNQRCKQEWPKLEDKIKKIE